jgi:site-specific recombinase XerD
MARDNLPAASEQFGSAHIVPASLLPPTLKAWKIYLEDQAVSIHTVKAFQSDLNLLAAYLPPDKTLGDISTSDLNQFLNWLQNGRGVPCSPKSLARRITSLKAFFRWLYQYGALIIDPAEKIPQKTVISPLPQVLSLAEAEKVLEIAYAHRTAQKPDARLYTLAALLLETGIKKGECLALNKNHLELEAADGPFIFVRYASPSNRYKERKIELTETWIAAFHEYAAQYDITDQLFPWSQRRLEYLLEDLGIEAGLNKHLSFDMCRWTCALNEARSGIEPNKIRQKLGVSKIQWREISLKLEQLSRL